MDWNPRLINDFSAQVKTQNPTSAFSESSIFQRISLLMPSISSRSLGVKAQHVLNLLLWYITDVKLFFIPRSQQKSHTKPCDKFIEFSERFKPDNLIWGFLLSGEVKRIKIEFTENVVALLNHIWYDESARVSPSTQNKGENSNEKISAIIYSDYLRHFPSKIRLESKNFGKK